MVSKKVLSGSVLVGLGVVLILSFQNCGSQFSANITDLASNKSLPVDSLSQPNQVQSVESTPLDIKVPQVVKFFAHSYPIDHATATQLTWHLENVGWVKVTQGSLTIYEGENLKSSASSYGVASGTIFNNFRVEGFASSDQSNVLTSHSFTIPVIVTTDIVAPSVPNDVQIINVTSGGATLTWSSATDNEGIARYIIYRGNQFEQVSSIIAGGENYSEFIVVSAPDNGAQLWISAVDNAGNESQKVQISIEIDRPEGSGGVN